MSCDVTKHLIYLVSEIFAKKQRFTFNNGIKNLFEKKQQHCHLNTREYADVNENISFYYFFINIFKTHVKPAWIQNVNFEETRFFKYLYCSLSVTHLIFIDTIV